MRYEKMLWGTLFIWMMSINSVAAPIVTLPVVATTQDKFALELLRNTLNRHQNVNFLNYHRELSTHGMVEAVRFGDMTVAWLPASYTDRIGLTTIEHPIFKGAFSYYQIYSNRQTQPSITNLDDLKTLTLGLRRGDGSSIELRQKGFKVVEFPNNQSLQLMLRGERFDAALLPVFAEHAAGSSLPNLHPLNTIVAIFNPYYFVVSNDNPDLANTIKKGLLSDHDTGKFDKNFYQTRWVSAAITELENEGYTFLTVDTEETVAARNYIDPNLLIALKPHQLLSAR